MKRSQHTEDKRESYTGEWCIESISLSVRTAKNQPAYLNNSPRNWKGAIGKM